MGSESPRKVLKDLMRLAKADKAVKLRQRSHPIIEFRRKGMSGGYVYAFSATPSCSRALKNMAADIRRGLDRLETAAPH